MRKLKRLVIVTLTAVGTLMAAILLIGFMIYESKEMPCGNTGNAKKTPPHVHYGIYTPSPISGIFLSRQVKTTSP